MDDVFIIYDKVDLQKSLCNNDSMGLDDITLIISE